jgi:hypothetical protein
MMSKIPSVNDTYFQHKVLTKVHGTPTYETLMTLSTELKANASSVPSTLGGGLYGHLGLILSAERYATLANSVPWINPGNPGPFAPPAGATAAQLEAAKDVWRELKYSFDFYQATEKALIAQVVDSIDPIYLRALLNRATGQYASGIRDVLLHLFSTHGKITPQQVKAKEIGIYNMVYSIVLPVDTVFNAVDDLVDLADHAGSALTNQQMIDLAYVVLSKEPIFQQDIRLWNRKPPADKTWDNMLEHFRNAQTDLNALPTAGELYHQGPHHANTVMTMVDMVTQRLQELYPPVEETPVVAPVPSPQANVAVQSRESSLAVREAALLAQMTEMMALMRTNNTTNSNRNTRGRGGGGRTNNRPTGGRGRGGASPRQYCWSHGYCAHGSTECNHQLPGHQTTATTTNMQGGSTNNCFWITPA